MSAQPEIPLPPELKTLIRKLDFWRGMARGVAIASVGNLVIAVLTLFHIRWAEPLWTPTSTALIIVGGITFYRFLALRHQILDWREGELNKVFEVLKERAQAAGVVPADEPERAVWKN